MSSFLTFNEDDGVLEAEVRGYRISLLTSMDYSALTQCETLDDLKLQLSTSSYGQFLANEPSPLKTTTIVEKCTEVMVNEFQHLLKSSSGLLYDFLSYVTYGYMIDNVVLLITGTLHGRDTEELLEKCHPLGLFDTLPSLTIATNASELYDSVIIDTPLAPYFEGCLSSDDLDELNIEVIRNALYKAYLEDFHDFCVNKVGGITGEEMDKLLSFEADRRSINITLNSFDTELTIDDRHKLFPRFGTLYPEILYPGTELHPLARAEDPEQVREILSGYPLFHSLAESVSFNSEKSLENAFSEHEVEIANLCYLQQFQYGVFYAWTRLKEQEIKNILWISECIAQNQRHKIHNFIPTDGVSPK